MALFKQTFTRVGGAPDVAALATAIRGTVPDPFYITPQLSTAGVVTVFVDKPAVWTGPQITAVQSAVTAAADATDLTDARNQLDNAPKWFRAAMLLLLDEINIVRTDPTTVLPARTEAQLWTAMKNRVATS